MSKLLDKLQKSSHTPNQSMGFRRSTLKSKEQTPTLIISLSKTDIGLIPDVIAAGADALLIKIEELNRGKSTLSRISKASGDTLWGIAPANIKREHIGLLLKTRCDFIVFDAATTSASLMEKEEFGKILKIEQLLDDELIETAGQLPIDAIFVDDQSKSSPSIHHLMLCQYLATLTDKPLLFTVPLETLGAELQPLRKYGVSGIVVDIKAGYSKESLARLRRDINKLPPIKKNQEKRSAILPTPALPAEEQTEEEWI